MSLIKHPPHTWQQIDLVNFNKKDWSQSYLFFTSKNLQAYKSSLEKMLVLTWQPICKYLFFADSAVRLCSISIWSFAQDKECHFEVHKISLFGS